MIKLSSNDVAAKIIKEYEDVEASKQREIDAKAHDKTMKKDDKYKTQVMK
jgi:hypothetical protein